MMCRREREIYNSKIPKTPSREFFFFAASDGNSWNSFALFLMNFGDSTKQLELVLCKIYSHSSNPYNKCGGGFHLKTTTTTQQVPNNKQKLNPFAFSSYPLTTFSPKGIFPTRKIRNGSNHKNEKKEMVFCKRQRRPILDLPKISLK